MVIEGKKKTITLELFEVLKNTDSEENMRQTYKNNIFEEQRVVVMQMLLNNCNVC